MALPMLMLLTLLALPQARANGESPWIFRPPLARWLARWLARSIFFFFVFFFLFCFFASR
jgi:hypothetical protein